jgi:hypothetical protein
VPASTQLEFGQSVDDRVLDPADGAPPTSGDVAPSVGLAASVRAAPPAGSAGDGDSSPWAPDFDEADDLGGLLAATSPLLARAFRTVGRDGG